ATQPTPPPSPPPVVNVPMSPAPEPAAAAAAGSATKESLLASEGDGRWGLIGVSTALGFGLYGWLVPIAVGTQNGTQIAGASLLTAAAGFFVPFGLTLNSPITWGMTNMFYGGATHGPLHAVLVMLLANYQFTSGQGVAALALGFGVAETAAAMLWA